eukprot:TRINITY_DN72947_c0_g1_i1.p1 TRINITY_DN72947_c0_g1~~TRINITY_DN72947_c0_g1_i1.p1  ORF type:complete len:749 (-),score=181.83 TRINITY_DN72947_c0_g1_i1:31-2277(-)
MTEFVASEVLIWNFPETSQGFLSDLPAPELFRPAALLRAASSGGGLVAFVTREEQLYLMDLGPTASDFGNPLLVEASRDKSVVHAACSPSGFVVVLTVQGAAYMLHGPPGLEEAVAAGRASLQKGAMLASFGRLEKLQVPLQICKVSCGNNHTLLLSNTGAVFAFGEGANGQLGLGDKLRSTAVPTCVESLANYQVVDLAAGNAHSCAVTSLKNFFAWGSNEHGQLGDGSFSSKSAPCLIGSIRGATAVAAAEASAVLVLGGAVFAWGFRSCCEPKSVFLGGRRARSIALSRKVLCAVSETGELLMVSLTKSAGKSVHEEACLAHDCVQAAAASADCVVALALSEDYSRHHGAPVADATASQRRLPSQVEMPAGSPGWPKKELSELAATNERLELALEELRAEHFLETRGLKQDVQDASSRLIRLGAESSQLQHLGLRQSYHKEALQLREELRMVKADLARELQGPAHDPVESEFLLSLVHTQDSRSTGDQTTDAVVKDLRSKHASLAHEESQLCQTVESLKAEVLAAQGEFAESNRRIQRIEEASIQARGVVERKRQRAAALWAQVKKEEEERRATSEAQQHRHREKTQTLQSECRELQERESQLQTEEAHAKKAVASVIEEHRRLVAAVSKQETGSKMESLTIERNAALRRLEDLALRAGRAEEMRMEAQSRALMELRRHAVAEEAAESALRQRMSDRAAAFTATTRPLYTEVQELHAALAELPELGVAETDSRACVQSSRPESIH